MKIITQVRSEQPFSTYDLGLAAALCASNYRLIKVQKNQGGKALFVFEHTEKLLAKALGHWSGDLKVSSLTYFNALKNLKNQLYST